MNICRTIFLVLWVTAGLALRSALAAPSDVGPLKIGFVLPLSGDYAFLGNGIRDGALLAQGDLRERGVVAQLIFEDNHGALAQSAAIGARLVSEGGVEGLVSIISGVGKVLQPIAASASVIHIGICSDSDVGDGKNSFINYFTAEQGVAKFVEKFSRELPQRTLGVFALNEAGFEKILQELKRQAAGKIQLVRIETYNSGSNDFRSQLMRMKGSRPDSLLLLGLSPEIELIARQARALQLSIPLTSIESFGLATDKSPFEGQWFVDSAEPSEEFQRKYRVKYGREVTPGAGHAYDSVMLLVEAARIGRERGLSLAEALRQISKYSGVVGALTVRRDGVIWSEASIRVIKNGQPARGAL
jgi:branched-chain amino acid transport system substrate-binding protein